MGFTISNYSLQGLQPQSFYVSIQGNYNIQKSTGPANTAGLLPSLPGSSAGLNIPNLILPYYTMTYNIYYSASKEAPVITQKQMIYNIQELPEPADIYSVIYGHIKTNINPDNIYSITDD